MACEALTRAACGAFSSFAIVHQGLQAEVEAPIQHGSLAFCAADIPLVDADRLAARHSMNLVSVASLRRTDKSAPDKLGHLAMLLAMRRASSRVTALAIPASR